MTVYDDPNRECVGLEPIWTGAGEESPPPEADEGDEAAATATKSKAKTKS